jgi:hypothetical protein
MVKKATVKDGMPSAKDWDKIAVLYLRGETLDYIVKAFPNLKLNKNTIMTKMSALGYTAKKRAIERKVLDITASNVEEQKVAVSNECIGMFNTGAEVIKMLLDNYLEELKDGEATAGKARATAYNTNLLMDGVTKIQKGLRVAYGMDEDNKLCEKEPEVLVIEGIDNGKI